MYDLIIIGGGPAGAAAAVYAGRKKMKTLLITESFGGQSIVSDAIENWIGETKISGFELAQKLEAQVRLQEDVEIKSSEKVTTVKRLDQGWEVITDHKGSYQTKTLLVASGGRRRHLGVSGEDKFEGRGVVYCSTCDAPLFRGKVVAVVGAGNAGLEASIDLLPYAARIYLLVRGTELSGDPSTQEQLQKNELVTIMYQVEVQEILGDKVVSGVRYKDNKVGKIHELALEGIFVEIGSVPNSEFMRGLVEMNKSQEIVVDHKTGVTSAPGVFAAGDVTDEIYKQNNIAVGNAIAATLSAYNYFKSL